ncbi:MAG: ATP-dependent endonuclease [Burkholderiales bacterium]|nr:ATP-dependent endonuclease [Burkholderiales bacterium]
MALAARARAVILVEGWSDQAAVDTLARRRGCDLRAEGILTVPIGGVTNLGAFVEMFGPVGAFGSSGSSGSSGPSGPSGPSGSSGLGLGLSGLCDAAEEAYARRTLERAGMGTHLTRAGLEALGFFVCEADLEDELIRALGTTAVLAVLEAQRELEAFRRFQEQPAQKGRSLHAQLHRFMGTRARRKIRYGSLLTEAIDLALMPRALERVLAHARAQASGGSPEAPTR